VLTVERVAPVVFVHSFVSISEGEDGEGDNLRDPCHYSVELRLAKVDTAWALCLIEHGDKNFR